MLGLVLAILTVFLLGVQSWIIWRQTKIFDQQTELGRQQATWRRDEALGAFYRVAHELADEFRKANVLPPAPIAANYDTHPRRMLREVSRLLAPLGTPVIFAATATA